MILFVASTTQVRSHNVAAFCSKGDEINLYLAWIIAMPGWIVYLMDVVRMLDGASQSIAYIWLGKTITNIQSKLIVGQRISEFVERDERNPSGGHVRRQSYFSRFTVVSRPSFMSKQVGSRRDTQFFNARTYWETLCEAFTRIRPNIMCLISGYWNDDRARKFQVAERAEQLWTQFSDSENDAGKHRHGVRWQPSMGGFQIVQGAESGDFTFTTKRTESNSNIGAMYDGEKDYTIDKSFETSSTLRTEKIPVALFMCCRTKALESKFLERSRAEAISSRAESEQASNEKARAKHLDFLNLLDDMKKKNDHIYIAAHVDSHTHGGGGALAEERGRHTVIVEIQRETVAAMHAECTCENAFPFCYTFILRLEETCSRVMDTSVLNSVSRNLGLLFEVFPGGGAFIY
jgi:hypothetical protein